MLEIFKKHSNLCYLLILVVLGLIFLFLGLGSFPLIDVDETRYATMARDMVLTGDWNNLMLNGQPFLEKPPLYFWLVASSISLFGKFTPLAVRFPIALVSFLFVIITYLFGKRVVSEKFGFYTASILLSSFFFLMLSHIAILDSLLMVFIGLSLYSGFMATICKPENKKWFWLGFYVSLGLGVLDKGILALGIPVLVMLLYLLITKNLKQLLHPVHLLGILVFMLIVTPWHYLMHKNYGTYFWIEYFVRHHFARFINSETIGRERPFLYFIPIFLVGFMPWLLLFIDMLIDGIKKGINKIKSGFVIENDIERIVLFATVSFSFIFLLFSVASTKLPTYILPVFPFASILMAYYWYNADEKGEHEKSLHVLTLTLATIFIIAAIAGSITCIFLPQEFFSRIEKVQILILSGLSLSGMLLTLRSNYKRVMSLFASYLIIMIFITTATVTKITNIMYMTGENELVYYSTITSNLPNAKLITFDFAVKPSVKINYTENVDFLTDPEFLRLDRLLKIYGRDYVFVIVKNKNINHSESYKRAINKRLELVHKGYKYSLYIKR